MAIKAANQENAREFALKIATEEETRKKNHPIESHEKSLIIIGSRGVGKTTMINRFLEKGDTPKPTLAMDYSYGRKAGKSLIKDIVHVWEVGHLSESLISSAMKGCSLSHSPHHTTVLIMLDLSRPDVLWNSLEECLIALRSAMESAYSTKIQLDLRKHKLRSLQERAKNEGDLVTDPFPIRMCIIAGKYDEFRVLDADDREFIGQTLRAVAHVLGAGLHYHSAKDLHLLKKTKELLSHYGFKGHAMKGSVTDYDKPLSIEPGSDSFAAINLRSFEDSSSVSLDGIKQIYETRFPQKFKEQNSGITDDPFQGLNFDEPIIDRLQVQREQEISVLLRDMMEAVPNKITIPEPY